MKRLSEIVSCPMAVSGKGNCATCMYCVDKSFGAGEQNEEIISFCVNSEVVCHDEN